MLEWEVFVSLGNTYDAISLLRAVKYTAVSVVRPLKYNN